MAAVQLDAAAIQALVQNAVQQALQAMQQAQQGPPPPPPPPPPAFALVPGDGAPNAPAWDFTSGDGMKLFLNGTKGLEKKFDGTQVNLSNFLQSVSDRADAFGWTAILRIRDNNNNVRDLTTECGTLSRANVLANANGYIHTNGRARQASNCLQLFLKASIDTDVLTELAQLKDDYTIMVQNESRINGALMLYTLISQVTIETRATVSNITLKLNNLAAVMEENKSDIKAFNTEVNSLVASLRARDAPVPDLTTQLFDAYKNCGDHKFVECIKRKQENYEDRTLDVTPPQLMKMALEKYKNLKDTSEWMKKSDQELEFIAMKAEFEARLSQMSKKKKPALAQNEDRPGKSKKGPRKNIGKWEWKGIAPKNGESQRKQVDGKWYIHCPYHGDTKWVLEVNKEGIEHRTGCRNKPSGDAPATPTTMTSAVSALTPLTQETISYAKALASIMASEDSGNLVQDEDEE